MNLEIKKVFPFISKTDQFILVDKLITDNNGSILDERLKESHGQIPIPNGVHFLDTKEYYNQKSFQYISHKFQVLNDLFIFVPKGLPSSFKTSYGQEIVDELRRSLNDLVELWISYQEHGYSVQLDFSWNRSFKRSTSIVLKLLLGKNGLFNRMTGCLWKYSLRGVAVPDPNLEFNEVKIPFKVLKNFVSKEDFRKAYGIPENIRADEAIKYLDGRRVLLGRNPSHDKSNLMSFVVRI